MNYALFDKPAPNQLNRSPSFQENLQKNERNFKAMKEHYFETISYIDLAKVAEDSHYLEGVVPGQKIMKASEDLPAYSNTENIFAANTKPSTSNTQQNFNPFTTATNSYQQPMFNNGNNNTGNTGQNNSNFTPRPSNRTEYILYLLITSLATPSTKKSKSFQ